MDESRNITIMHCECGREETLKANTTSGVLLKADASPWKVSEHAVKCGGHCRGVCPDCQKKTI